MSQLVDQWEVVVDAMADRLVEAWDVMSGQIGDRPFFNDKVPEREQARQYQLVRNDPQAWMALMQEHGFKATKEYMIRGERLTAKYPDEAQVGQDAAMGAQMMAAAPAAAQAPPAGPAAVTMPQTPVPSPMPTTGAPNG